MTHEAPATFFGPPGDVVTGPDEVLAAFKEGASHFTCNDATNHLEILQWAADGNVAYYTGIQRATARLMVPTRHRTCPSASPSCSGARAVRGSLSTPCGHDDGRRRDLLIPPWRPCARPSSTERWLGLYMKRNNDRVSHLIMLNSLDGVEAPWELRSALEDPERPGTFNQAPAAYYTSTAEDFLARWNGTIPVEDKSQWRDPAVARGLCWRSIR